ncbi:hypothetical protein OESDEN_10149 [Oesophagostomum dentatum]|uniref:Serpin domain-containing protein n=1 Tax=Oesophagostomum dentatum TaxID=61180 RepID=A0A0B1SXH4_OESDE|nr:hypothetical protein OESDEN_10149 [Oesophagostomum dentatum]
MALNMSSDSMFLMAETDFGLSLLRHAPATQSLVVSPLSVMFALSMVQLGSKGNTKSQINSLLSKGILSKNFQIEKDYENTVTKRYPAKLESLDFSKAEEAAKIIDGFISNVTESKIHDMVNADSVSAIRGNYRIRKAENKDAQEICLPPG